jgi:hypothetical protein
MSASLSVASKQSRARQLLPTASTDSVYVPGSRPTIEKSPLEVVLLLSATRLAGSFAVTNAFGTAELVHHAAGHRAGDGLRVSRPAGSVNKIP